MSKTSAVTDAWEDDWETAADVRALRTLRKFRMTNKSNRSYQRLRLSPLLSRRKSLPKSVRRNVEPRPWNSTANCGLKRMALHYGLFCTILRANCISEKGLESQTTFWKRV
jgi:hypothetical protein